MKKIVQYMPKLNYFYTERIRDEALGTSVLLCLGQILFYKQMCCIFLHIKDHTLTCCRGTE